MPDIALGRDEQVPLVTREGGNFFLALDGPTGEALHVNIGIQDPCSGDVLKRQFTPQQALDIANSLTELATIIEERK